jgi:hypothetical protein
MAFSFVSVGIHWIEFLKIKLISWPDTADICGLQNKVNTP